MARKSRGCAEAYSGTPHRESRRLTQPGRKLIAPMSGDPGSVTVIMAANPHVVGIWSRTIISDGRRWPVIVWAVPGTKRGGRNSCCSSNDGPRNRYRKEKRIAATATIGVRTLARNRHEKSESDTCCNNEFSCFHFCLLKCHGHNGDSRFLREQTLWLPDSSTF